MNRLSVIFRRISIFSMVMVLMWVSGIWIIIKFLSRTYELEDFRFTPLLGLDGLIGLEYRFPEFPLLISVDAKPYFEYSTIQIFSIYLQSIGFSIKYRF